MPYARVPTVLMCMCVCLALIGGVHCGACSGGKKRMDVLVPKRRLNCRVDAQPEFPSLSPARFAAKYEDSITDVVMDFFNQFKKLDPDRESGKETVKERKEKALEKQPYLDDSEESLSVSVEERPDPSEEGPYMDTQPMYGPMLLSGQVPGETRSQETDQQDTSTVSIILHGSKRVSQERLSKVAAELHLTNKFAQVVLMPSDIDQDSDTTLKRLLVLDRQIREAFEEMDIILFTDDVQLIHWARQRKNYYPNLFEGYLFGSPQIASGLRMYAALQETADLDHDQTWGTHYPGGVDWFKASKIIRLAKKQILTNEDPSKDGRGRGRGRELARERARDGVRTAWAAIQGILTTSYMSMEELMNGVRNVMTFIWSELANAKNDDIGWVFLFDDQPFKSNCWLAKIVNKIVRESGNKSVWPRFISRKYVHSMFDEWEGPLPSRVIVLVIDDNSCSGSQLRTFMQNTVQNLFKSTVRPREMDIVLAPIFSTRSAMEKVSFAVKDLVTKELDNLDDGLPPVSLKAEYPDLQFDSITRQQLQLCKTKVNQDGLCKTMSLTLIQYVELESVLRKVFVGPRRRRESAGSGLDPALDPRNNYSKQNAFQILNSAKTVNGKERQDTTFRDPSVLDGKISTAFDWKIVDTVSMPKELMFGEIRYLLEPVTMKKIMEYNLAPEFRDAIRFLQGTCPPYKVPAMEDKAMWCDEKISENWYSESLYFGPSSRFLGKRYAVEESIHKRIFLEFLAPDAMVPPDDRGSRLCDRMGKSCTPDRWAFLFKSPL